MKILQSQDTIVPCSLFSLCLSVMLSVVALRTLVVLGIRLMRPSIFAKKNERGVHERGTRDGNSLAALCSTRRVELRCWFLGITPLKIKGRALPSESWACWLAFLVVQLRLVD
jgi:hypothetical protein